jgi:hypothetical protein
MDKDTEMLLSYFESTYLYIWAIYIFASIWYSSTYWSFTFRRWYNAYNTIIITVLDLFFAEIIYF